MLCVSIFLVSAPACTPDRRDEADLAVQSGSAESASSEGFPSYNFERPDVAIALHDDLDEISGLTLLADGHLGAVQDEAGMVFVLDGDSGEILERRSFGDDGDYEGIERVGDQIFVLRSDGSLFELTIRSADELETRVIETSLAARNDTEGLAYDEANDRLLIACKERPGAGLDDRQRSMYAFDLSEGTLRSDPAFTIDTGEIDRRFGGKGKFKPSALAVHPSNGSVYVLSSTSKSLAVLDEDGGIQRVWRLPESLFEQPEGLAFLADATLYIASEGVEGPGMLYAFSAGAERR